MQCASFLIFFVLIIQIATIADVNGHAIHLVTDQCSRSISVDTIIMGEPAITNNERNLVITRQGSSNPLTSGSLYCPGEVLTVQMSTTLGEYVFETTHGTFVGGGCAATNRKSTNIGEVATLVMPQSGAGHVLIRGAWALQHGTVTIVAPVTLIEGSPCFSGQDLSYSGSVSFSIVKNP